VEDIVTRFWQELVARPAGPMGFRFFMQPTMAILFAVRDGRRDAQRGQPAYFWALFTEGQHRRAMLLSGWRSLSKLLIVALLLDLVYQAVAIGHFRPLEAIVTAFVLGVFPYLLLRGPVNRLLRPLLRPMSNNL
jgi:hypothetical protein